VRRRMLAATVAIVAVAGTGALPPQAALGARKFPNCAALNKRFSHGVGLPGARDRTSGEPVTNFRRSRPLYRANRHLDRDRDRIACEKQ
jgi:Excalibur calcium-binding domain